MSADNNRCRALLDPGMPCSRLLQSTIGWQPMAANSQSSDSFAHYDASVLVHIIIGEQMRQALVGWPVTQCCFHIVEFLEVSG